jgi:hypothetical protein
MRARLLLGFALLLGLGCGSGKFAPISGTVTMNGKPLAGATVMFSPIAKEGTIDAGPGSGGKTNEKGEYTLTSVKGHNGALVGKHRVSISLMNQGTGESESDDRRRPGQLRNQVPVRYNGKTELTYEVPAGGTDKADFALKSP